MKIVFMGSSSFSLPSLEAIKNEGYQVPLVFTTPDKPRGRGRKVGETPVKIWCRENSLSVYQPDDLRTGEVIQKLKEIKPDLIVVVAYGKILPQDILKIPPLGCVNLHPSLLPELRGAGAINWAIILGKERTGVTTFFMDEGMDSGDIIFQKEVRIEEDDNSLILSRKLAREGAGLLIQTISAIEKGEAPRIPQIGIPTYAPLLSKETGRIKWIKSAREIHNLVRGTIPWPTAYTFLGKIRIIFWMTDVEEENSEGEPGEIRDISPHFIKVSTGKGYLLVKELQREGRKRMRIEEFLKGFPLKKGDLFKSYPL